MTSSLLSPRPPAAVHSLHSVGSPPSALQAAAQTAETCVCVSVCVCVCLCVCLCPLGKTSPQPPLVLSVH